MYHHHRSILLLVLILFSFLFIVTERATASEEESFEYLGSVNPEVGKKLQATPIDSKVILNLNGKFYITIYKGEKIIDGEKQYTVDAEMKEISATAARDAEKAILNGKNLSNSSPHQDSKNSETASASNAAITAAATKVIYRIFSVSPELDQRISKGQANLAEAQAATQVAITNYKLEVDKSVQNAAAALASLAKELNEASKPLPKSSKFLSNASSIDFSTSDPAIRQSLTSSYYKIANAEIRTPIDQEVQQLGIAALSVAEFEASNGDIGVARSAAVAANAYAEFLTSAADLLIGIDPISGFVRDSYELVVGTNWVTGESLSDIERALRAVSAGANLVTLGASPVVIGGIKTISKITQRTKDFKRAREIFEIVEGLPFTEHGLERFIERGSRYEAKGATITPDWIKKTIQESTPYWDLKNSTVAFHSSHESGFVLRVAIDLKASPKPAIATIIIDKPEQLSLDALYKNKPRFVPYENPIPRILIPYLLPRGWELLVTSCA